MLQLDPAAIYTKEDLAKGLELTTRTIDRHVARGTFPRPATPGKKPVWLGAALLKHFEREHAKAEARR